MKKRNPWLVTDIKADPFLYKIPYEKRMMVFYRQLWKGPHIVAPHYHQDIEILLSLDLYGEMKVSGKNYALRPGIVFVVPSNAVHLFRYAKGVEGTLFVLQLHTPYLVKLFKSLLPTPYDQIVHAISSLNVENPKRSAELPLLIKKLAALESAKNTDILGTMEKLEIILTIMRTLFKETANNVDTDSYNENDVKRIMDIIGLQAFSSETSLDSIAKTASMSKFHLCHVFKNGTGTSVHSYLNTIRIAKACELIKKGNNITETANKCGFGSLSHFIQLFKSVVGITPKQWYRQKTDVAVPKF
ncbi:MAG: helix-turn-helix domain-containing protein [Fibrobacteres bacterium]|nr:helix-turn-helix domain-containing protein [Fibrobacterota bacterium]